MDTVFAETPERDFNAALLSTRLTSLIEYTQHQNDEFQIFSDIFLSLELHDSCLNNLLDDNEKLELFEGFETNRPVMEDYDDESDCSTIYYFACKI